MDQVTFSWPMVFLWGRRPIKINNTCNMLHEYHMILLSRSNATSQIFGIIDLLRRSAQQMTMSQSGGPDHNTEEQLPW